MQDDNETTIDAGAVVLAQPGQPLTPIRPADVAEVPPAQHACPNLSKALSRARDQCKMASKDKVNTFHKYAYASADEVIQTAKDALEGTGLAIIPQSQELTVIAAGNLSMYALNRTIFLSHSSGEYVPLSIKGWPVVPEKGRPLDKAFAVALTTSMSYLLRDLLQMPRGESDDMNSDDANREAAPPPAQRQEPPRQTPAPTGPPPVQMAAKDLEESETLEQLAGVWEIIRTSRRLTSDEKIRLAALKDQRKAALAGVPEGETGDPEADPFARLPERTKTERQRLEATK